MNRYEQWLSFKYDEVISSTLDSFICVYLAGGTSRLVKNFITSFMQENSISYKRAKILIYYHIGNLASNGRYYMSKDGLFKSFKKIENDKIFSYNDETLFHELKERVLSRQEYVRNKLATATANGFDNKLTFFKELFHYTDEEVARKTRISVERYKAIEKNPMIMQISDLFLLCDLYNVSPNELLSFKSHYKLIMSEVFDDKK